MLLKMAFSTPKRNEICFEALHDTKQIRIYAKTNHVYKTTDFKENSNLKNIFSRIFLV